MGGLSRSCFAQKRFSSTKHPRQSDESVDTLEPSANATHSTEPTPTKPKPKPKFKQSKPKPAQRNHPRIHLLNHQTNLIRFTPSASSIPLNTSLAPPNFKPTLSNFPRPSYLPTALARLIPAHAFTRSLPEPYVLARSVELFGLPGETDWVAELSERLAAGVVVEKVTDVLGRLEWSRRDVRSLKEAAWAEHLVAMQNPRLETGMDEDLDAPPWPSTDSALAPVDRDPPSLSWSMSGERDEPPPIYTRFSSAPIHWYGKHTFPRPKRIIRLRPYDKSLVLVLASPTARRAVLAAYAYWIRRELGTAFKDRDDVEKYLGKGRNVWPPVSEPELGRVRREDQDYETMFSALQWATRVGWRPAFRIRPFEGTRQWGDEWHPRGRWSAGHGGEA